MRIERFSSEFVHSHESMRERVQNPTPSPSLSLEQKQKPVEVQALMPNRELLDRFSEWYLRMGKAYEETKSYRQAISAYEKSYAVSPAFSKAASIESLRGKILER